MDILFKGFSADANSADTIDYKGKKIPGKWVYGYYYAVQGRHYIVPADAQQFYPMGNVSPKYEVIADTVKEA